MGSILIAGTDKERRDVLRAELEREGHLISEAASSAATLVECAACGYDLLVLESRIGDAGAAALCRRVRQASDLGIIVLLSEADGEQCRIDTLNAGADDYLSEGFIIKELHARVRAILRRIRVNTEDSAPVLLKDRTVDFRSYEIQGPGGQVAHLTPKECQVLRYLITHPGKTVHHRELSQSVWQRDGSGGFEYVRFVVSQLRRKIEPDHRYPQYILTERSGYRFTSAAYRTDNQATVQ